jgi:ribose 5-phosphate isomerase A
MTAETYKRAAAARALDFVRPGMRIGLGTGSTAKHFVELLAEQVRAGLDLIAVPTSETTRAQAERLGIPLTTLDETPALDLTVDGADEIAPDLTLIKGGGAALLREKIVAAASAQMVVIADESKWVSILGTFPLPIEIAPVRRGGDPWRGGTGDGRSRLSGAGGIAQGAGWPPGGDRRWALAPRRAVAAHQRSAGSRGAAFPGAGRDGARLVHRMAQTAIVAGADGVRLIERP